MQIHVKAALLSAFVLPGLGQIYKGDKLKGAIIIVLVNIFLLLAVFLVLRELGPLIVSAKLTGTYDATKIMERLQEKSPAARYLLTTFGGLWLYSWVDAALGKKRDDEPPAGH